MAASKTNLIKSLVFTPSGGSAIAFEGIEELIVRKDGQVVAHITDAVEVVTAHFFDAGEAEFTARLRNAEYANDTNLDPGTVGTVVATYKRRKAGKGSVSGQDRTISSQTGGAMVAPSSFTLPQLDRSTAEITWKCSDPAGAAALVFGGPA